MSDTVWNSVNLVIGIPGLVDVCLKMGSELFRLIQDHRHSAAIAKELTLKLSTQQDILKNLKDVAERLGDELRKEVMVLVGVLRDTLMETMELASKMNLFGQEEHRSWKVVLGKPGRGGIGVSSIEFFTLIVPWFRITSFSNKDA
jgi:hypothetical protein